jgi:MFS family permease
MLLQGMAMGVTAPIVPIFAAAVGADDRFTGAVFGCFGLGRVLFDVPGGVLTHRYDCRVMQLAACGLFAVGTLIALAFFSQAGLIAAALTWGMAVALHFTARVPMMAEMVEPARRGRLMSILGGAMRWSIVLSAVLAGFVIDVASIRWALACQLPLMAGTFLSLQQSQVIVDVNEKLRQHRDDHRASENPASPWDLLWRHRFRVVTTSFYTGSLLGLRSARRMALAVAAVRLGLRPTAVGGVVALSSLIDACCFPLSGVLMDRYGRRASAVPTVALTAVGFVFLAYVDGLTALTLTALFFGLAETPGSGVLPTLLADAAVKEGGATFVGVMRALMDSGLLTGPVLFGYLSHGFSLRTACLCMALWGAFTAFIAAYVMPVKALPKPAAAPKTQLEGEAADAAPGYIGKGTVRVAIGAAHCTSPMEDRRMLFNETPVAGDVAEAATPVAGVLPSAAAL